jgi:hypothetical protein
MRRYAASLQPDEVNLLSQFLQEELDRRHLTREGVAAEELAAKIFSLYQAGVRDVEDLRQLISVS